MYVDAKRKANRRPKTLIDIESKMGRFAKDFGGHAGTRGNSPDAGPLDGTSTNIEASPGTTTDGNFGRPSSISP